MNLDDFQKETLFTWRSELPFADQLVNVVLGFAEFGEILTTETKDEFVDECGDFLYYLAMLCNLNNISLAEQSKNINKIDYISPFNQEKIMANTFVLIFEMQSYAKKLRFHNKPLPDFFLPNVAYFVTHMLGLLETGLRQRSTTLEETLQLNIEKLKQRHKRKDGEHNFIEATN